MQTNSERAELELAGLTGHVTQVLILHADMCTLPRTCLLYLASYSTA